MRPPKFVRRAHFALSLLFSIPLPLIIVHSGQVLEAMLCDNGFTHRSCFDDRVAIVTLANLSEPRREQTGVQAPLAVFGDGRARKQRGELAAREVRPGDGCGLALNIGSIHAQIARDLEVPTETLVDPGVMPAPDLIHDVNDVLEPGKGIDAPDIRLNRLESIRGILYIQYHHSSRVVIRHKPVLDQ